MADIKLYFEMMYAQIKIAGVNYLMLKSISKMNIAWERNEWVLHIYLVGSVTPRDRQRVQLQVQVIVFNLAGNAGFNSSFGSLANSFHDCFIPILSSNQLLNDQVVSMAPNSGILTEINSMEYNNSLITFVGTSWTQLLSELNNFYCSLLLIPLGK